MITIAIFNKESNCDGFFSIKLFTVFLTFTFEKKTDDKLPLLDVVVEKADSELFITVYQKLTCTGQYTHWIPLLPPPQKRKTNLIVVTMPSALCMYSKPRLLQYLNNITPIRCKNGYQDSFIQISVSKPLPNLRSPREKIKSQKKPQSV